MTIRRRLIEVDALYFLLHTTIIEMGIVLAMSLRCFYGEEHFFIDAAIMEMLSRRRVWESCFFIFSVWCVSCIFINIDLLALAVKIVASALDLEREIASAGYNLTECFSFLANNNAANRFERLLMAVL